MECLPEAGLLFTPGFDADEVADRGAMWATGAAFRFLEGVFLLAGLPGGPPTLMEGREGREGSASLMRDVADEGASGSPSSRVGCVDWRRSVRQVSKNAAARADKGVDMAVVEGKTHRLPAG